MQRFFDILLIISPWWVLFLFLYFEVRFAKKKNRLIGLILPFVCLLYSLYGFFRGNNAGHFDLWQDLHGILLTVVLLGVYLYCRKKYHTLSD